MREASEAIQAARRRRAHGVAADFDGARLALARRLQRSSRTALAKQVGLTPAAITQFERNQSRPTTPVIAQLALTLGVPPDFFRNGRPIQSIPTSAAHFRSLRATPALSRDQALAFAELALDVVEVVEQHVDLPGVDLPDLNCGTDLTMAQVSRASELAREALQVPHGPIAHVVRLLETKGILVLRLPGHVDKAVDAFSTYEPKRPIVLLSPVKDDKARSRFDASHELGHLLLHRDAAPGDKIIESQAQSFAANFLMPAEEVAEDLPRRVDWEKLHIAKRKWGTSLKALVYRAHVLGVMGDGPYRRAMRELALMGVPEPGRLGPPEAPVMLGSAIDLLAINGFPLDRLASDARLPLSQAEMVVDAGSERRPAVRL